MELSHLKKILTVVQHATPGIAKLGRLGNNVATLEQITIKIKQPIATYLCTAAVLPSSTATTPIFKQLAEIIQPDAEETSEGINLVEIGKRRDTIS